MSSWNNIFVSLIFLLQHKHINRDTPSGTSPMWFPMLDIRYAPWQNSNVYIGHLGFLRHQRHSSKLHPLLNLVPHSDISFSHAFDPDVGINFWEIIYYRCMTLTVLEHPVSNVNWTLSIGSCILRRIVYLAMAACLHWLYLDAVMIKLLCPVWQRWLTEQRAQCPHCR